MCYNMHEIERLQYVYHHLEMMIAHTHIYVYLLMFKVLRLFHFLVKFGYYGSDDIKSLLKPLLNLLNGKHDKPFPPDNTEKNTYSKDAMKQVNVYRNKERYEVCFETAAIVNAKYQYVEYSLYVIS